MTPIFLSFLPTFFRDAKAHDTRVKVAKNDYAVQLIPLLLIMQEITFPPIAHFSTAIITLPILIINPPFSPFHLLSFG